MNTKTVSTYPDEYLHYWSDRFIERGVANYGITLDSYLAHPHEIEAALAGEADLPLLLKQRAVSQRQLDIEMEEERQARAIGNLPMRNGAPFEPLHHHAHPDNKQSNFNMGRERHAD